MTGMNPARSRCGLRPTLAGFPGCVARDRRIDLLRGFAVLAVFIDHVPGNALHLLTLQTNAFSDAADIFVFLAGYSAWLAYTRAFEHGGVWAGTRRVLARCARVYAMQVAVMATCLAITSAWFKVAGLEPYSLAPLHGATLARVLVLNAQPQYFDVLPLYVCLLAAFPLMWVGLRRWPCATVLASAGMWLLVNLDRGLNLPEWLSQGGWAFNPFEWQFLFVLGAAAGAASASSRHPLGRKPWITATCWILLIEAWLRIRYLDWQPSSVPGPHLDEAGLAFPHLLRLLSGLSIMYLVMNSERFGRLAGSGRMLAIEACGRHSLAIFGLGSILSLIGRLTFFTAGDGPFSQAGINGVGLFTLIAAARLLDRKRQDRGPLPTSWHNMSNFSIPAWSDLQQAISRARVRSPA